MCYTIDEVKSRVSQAVIDYNSTASSSERISRISLFGSYADGSADDDSYVDLLVSFPIPLWVSSLSPEQWKPWKIVLRCPSIWFRIRFRKIPSLS